MDEDSTALKEMLRDPNIGVWFDHVSNRITNYVYPVYKARRYVCVEWTPGRVAATVMSEFDLLMEYRLVTTPTPFSPSEQERIRREIEFILARRLCVPSEI